MGLWKNSDWTQIRREVRHKQSAIYEAALKNDTPLVHLLQKELTESLAAKMLAIKRVTQDNRGKACAGIDGKKRLTVAEREALIPRIKLDEHSHPIRRVWIDIPGKSKRRPLGIPTIEDRAKQMLAKLALEPEWESKFEAHSFGYRPGRRTMEMTWRARHKIRYGVYWVLDADVSKFFQRIKHEELLNKLNTWPVMEGQIRAWLEAGIFEKGDIFPAERGTPQGGVISPLLGNVALDGCQMKIWDALYAKFKNKKIANRTLYLRYADDILIICATQEHLEIAKAVLQEHIGIMGLELNLEKTRTIQTLNNSFDCLGLTVSQRKVSKYKKVKVGHNKEAVQLQVMALPQKEKIKEHFRVLSKALKKSAQPIEVIRKLNPIIRGWRNYFKYSDGRTFGNIPGALDMRINVKLRHWLKRRFQVQGLNRTYWAKIQGNNWNFHAVDKITGKTIYLEKYSSVKWSLIEYRPIIPSKTPYDGDVLYWCNHIASSNKTFFEISARKAYLFKKQKGRCPFCNDIFSPDDLDYVEIDHIRPRKEKGSNLWRNLQLLHKECHAVKTRTE